MKTKKCNEKNKKLFILEEQQLTDLLKIHGNEERRTAYRAGLINGGVAAAGVLLGVGIARHGWKEINKSSDSEKLKVVRKILTTVGGVATAVFTTFMCSVRLKPIQDITNVPGVTTEEV